MKTELDHLKSHNLTLTKAVNIAQNGYSGGWLLAMSGTTHS